MRGGVVFFRGTGGAARAYLEGDHSNADEYFLEGGGAEAHIRAYDGAGTATLPQQLTGEEYQSWVDWTDPSTGMSRGEPQFETRINADGEIVKLPASPRFAEMTVNCDKTLSVAAFLSPEVSEALDAAQNAAADAMSAYLASHSVTRMEAPRVNGERRRVLVPVERFEEVRIKHQTSRSGDPHRHLHVQWNTRVWAEGKWRGLWTAPTLNQQGALRGIGEAVIATHPGLRDALAKAGLTFDAASGKVLELEAHSAVFSKRHAQISGHLEKLEREWKQEHGGAEPPRELRAKWQFQAWADGRPQKTHSGGRAIDQWLAECEHHGLQTEGFVPQSSRSVPLSAVSPAQATAWAVARLEGERSAWSVADLAGQIGKYVATQNVIDGSTDAVRGWVEQVAAVAASSLPRLVEFGETLPGWTRAYTSPRVIEVEQALTRFFREAGLDSVHVPGDGRTASQEAARALASEAPLVVVEGAAGSGKTTMLANAAYRAGLARRNIVVVAPTRVAAQEAANAIKGPAWSIHRLLHQHGWRMDEHERWATRLQVGQTDPTTGAVFTGPGDEFRIRPGTRIVVDEAGMVSQDLTYALVQLAQESGATLGLVGDRAQLSAPGRGGVLHLAVNNHPTPLDMDELHRFTDKEYGKLTLSMRERVDDGLFNELYERGNIVVHPDLETAREEIANASVRAARMGAEVSVAADSNDAATALNARIQEARAEGGHTRKTMHPVAGSDGLTVRVGDPVMTRGNDDNLMVSNREVWTVHQTLPDGGMSVQRNGELRRLPAKYVAEHTHLAYATTEHGVQGRSTDFGHGIVTDQTTAAGLYVAATRGRDSNLIHVVAESKEHAHEVFTQALGRDRGDLGVQAAREAAQKQLDGLTPDRVLTKGELAGKLAVAEAEHARLVRRLPSVREELRAAQDALAAQPPYGSLQDRAARTRRAQAAALVSRLEQQVRDVEHQVQATTPEAVTRAHEASKERLAAALASLQVAREQLAQIDAPGYVQSARGRSSDFHNAKARVAAAEREVQAAETAVHGPQAHVRQQSQQAVETRQQTRGM